jgi:hypothetical protein
MIDRSYTRFARWRKIPQCHCDWCRDNLNPGLRQPCEYCGKTDCPAAQEHWQKCRKEFSKEESR